MKSVEIICSRCGAETLLRREAVYDGFTRTGEKLTCSSCGHVFADESEITFKNRASTPAVFTDADRPTAVEVFDEGENAQLCRYCANYIVNPFTQFCALHRREVQATDSCERFEKTAEEKESGPLL